MCLLSPFPLLQSNYERFAAFYLIGFGRACRLPLFHPALLRSPSVPDEGGDLLLRQKGLRGHSPVALFQNLRISKRLGRALFLRHHPPSRSAPRLPLDHLGAYLLGLSLLTVSGLYPALSPEKLLRPLFPCSRHQFRPLFSHDGKGAFNLEHKRGSQKSGGSELKIQN